MSALLDVKDDVDVCIEKAVGLLLMAGGMEDKREGSAVSRAAYDLERGLRIVRKAMDGLHDDGRPA